MKSTRILGLVALIAISACNDQTAPKLRKTAALSIEFGGDQTGEVGKELATAITIKAKDSLDAAVPNQLINFIVTQGGGSVFAGSAITNAQGEAKERWTMGDVPGENLMEARAVDQVSGAAIVFATVKATAVVGPPTVIEASQSTIVSRVELEPRIRLLDAKGNPVAGITVNWAVTVGPGTLSVPSSVTDANGIATVRFFVNNVSGQHRCTGTVDGLAVQTFGATIS